MGLSYNTYIASEQRASNVIHVMTKISSDRVWGCVLVSVCVLSFLFLCFCLFIFVRVYVFVYLFCFVLFPIVFSCFANCYLFLFQLQIIFKRWSDNTSSWNCFHWLCICAWICSIPLPALVCKKALGSIQTLSTYHFTRDKKEDQKSTKVIMLSFSSTNCCRVYFAISG